MKHKGMAIVGIVMLVLGIFPASVATATAVGAQVSHMDCQEMLVVYDQAPDGLTGTIATAVIQQPDGTQVTVNSNPGFYPGGSSTAKWSFPSLNWWVEDGHYIVISVSLPGGAVVHNLPYGADVNGCELPPEMCEWNPQLPADDPGCVPPEVCEWDPTIPADDPGCVPPEMCPWDETLPVDDPGCVPPEVCEWNRSLAPDDPLCQPPQDPCQWNFQLSSDDPLCDPPYEEGPSYCFLPALVGGDPHAFMVNGVSLKWEFNDGLPGSFGRWVIPSGAIVVGQQFELAGTLFTSSLVNGEPICYPISVPVADPQGESPVTGGVPLA